MVKFFQTEDNLISVKSRNRSKKAYTAAIRYLYSYHFLIICLKHIPTLSILSIVQKSTLLKINLYEVNNQRTLYYLSNLLITSESSKSVGFPPK